MAEKNASVAFFEAVEVLAEDPIFGVPILFQSDKRPQKVNLSIGAYKDADGNSYILNAVREAEALLQSKNLDKDYQSIEGNKQYIEECLKLIYGEKNPQVQNGLVYGIQSLGGTGALRIGGEFLARTFSKKIFISEISWPNHQGIFSRAGMQVETFPYLNVQSHALAFDKMTEAIRKMPAGSTLLLQAGCHNPTGVDPSKEQWKQLSALLKEGHIMPFFDFAYQGFDQDPEADAFPIRYFVQEGHEMLVASSNAKNFGLYGERVGMLSIVAHHPDHLKKVVSQFKRIIRANYSTPPIHGARIVAAILSNDSLKTEWMHELKNMRDRVVEMRVCLAFTLQNKIEHRDFSYINKEKGMFSLLNLTDAQAQQLREDFGIYVVGNGRINIAGLNMHNIEYVANAIAKWLSASKV